MINSQTLTISLMLYIQYKAIWTPKDSGTKGLNHFGTKHTNEKMFKSCPHIYEMVHLQLFETHSSIAKYNAILRFIQFRIIKIDIKMKYIALYCWYIDICFVKSWEFWPNLSDTSPSHLLSEVCMHVMKR